jgi:hypothetical protein
MTNAIVFLLETYILAEWLSALVLYYNYVVVIVVLSACAHMCVQMYACMCVCDLLNSSFTEGRLLLSN